MRSLTRLILAAVWLVPSLALADQPVIISTPTTPTTVATTIEILSPAEYGMAKPAKFPSSNRPNAHLGDPTLQPRTYREPFQTMLNEHINAPSGCNSPLGCGTLYSEFKFVFGSCRQFFGTGDSIPGTVFTPHNRQNR